MSTLPLSAVSAGLYAALNVNALTSLASGPYDSIVPQGASFPYVWFDVAAENARGLGRGGLRQVNVRVHAAGTGTATAGAAKQVQGIQSVIVELLEDAALALDGYAAAGEVFYGETTEPFDSVIAGVPCVEVVSNFYLWVEP